MQSAMLSLISGQKSPEATPIVKGNSEAPSMQFISLLGASEQDGRGVPGARSFPGEFRPGANSLENSRTLLSMAPVQSTEQDRGFSSQFEFTTPPQTERVRDSQSYFYAAGMERSSTAPEFRVHSFVRLGGSFEVFVLPPRVLLEETAMSIRLFHRFTRGLGQLMSAVQLQTNVQLWWTRRWAANQLGQSGTAE